MVCLKMHLVMAFGAQTRASAVILLPYFLKNIPVTTKAGLIIVIWLLFWNSNYIQKSTILQYPCIFVVDNLSNILYLALALYFPENEQIWGYISSGSNPICHCETISCSCFYCTVFFILAVLLFCSVLFFSILFVLFCFISFYNLLQ